jgi:hypothetical protein
MAKEGGRRAPGAAAVTENAAAAAAAAPRQPRVSFDTQDEHSPAAYGHAAPGGAAFDADHTDDMYEGGGFVDTRGSGGPESGDNAGLDGLRQQVKRACHPHGWQAIAIYTKPVSIAISRLSLAMMSPG